MAPENFQPSFHALAIINLVGASQALLSAAAAGARIDYIRATTGESVKLRGKIVLHFLPAVLFGLLWIADLFINKEVKIVNYLDRLANPVKFDPAQLIALLIVDLQRGSQPLHPRVCR